MSFICLPGSLTGEWLVGVGEVHLHGAGPRPALPPQLSVLQGSRPTRQVQTEDSSFEPCIASLLAHTCPNAAS